MLTVFLIILFVVVAASSFYVGKVACEKNLFEKNTLIDYLEAQLNELESHLEKIKSSEEEISVKPTATEEKTKKVKK